MKHPRGVPSRKRANYMPIKLGPPTEPYQPTELEIYEATRPPKPFSQAAYRRRAVPKADRSLTPLPTLKLTDAEAVAASLPTVPTDYCPVPLDGRSKPVAALLFDTKGLGEMCDLIQQGFTLQDIAEWHGLAPTFLYDAYARDLCGIRKSFDKAALECKLHHLKRVKDGSINYQSSTWFLERKFRDEYGKEQTVNVRPTGQTKKTTWDLGDGKMIEFN